MSGKTRVYLEVSAKRALASAADWPGWCRAGKGEQAALEALAAYAPRYAKVARLAKVPFSVDATDFDVAERLTGNATTDYGVPGIAAKDEERNMSAKESERMRDLLAACWKYLDEVVKSAPDALRKGPRGGGRDRDPMFEHVLGAEAEYVRHAGARLKQPDGKDETAVRAFRKAILDVLAKPGPETRWPVPYLIRRTAWHALDHAWEMEDRS